MISFAFLLTPHSTSIQQHNFSMAYRVCTKQIFTLSPQQPKSHLYFSLSLLSIWIFSLNSWQNVFHPTFLPKALDVLHGCSNFQLMSQFFRFRKSYQWIWLLNRNFTVQLVKPKFSTKLTKTKTFFYINLLI